MDRDERSITTRVRQRLIASIAIERLGSYITNLQILLDELIQAVTLEALTPEAGPFTSRVSFLCGQIRLAAGEKPLDDPGKWSAALRKKIEEEMQRLAAETERERHAEQIVFPGGETIPITRIPLDLPPTVYLEE